MLAEQIECAVLIRTGEMKDQVVEAETSVELDLLDAFGRVD